MFNLDIELFMDNDTVDLDGSTRITKDASKHGIHAQLGAGDGGTTTPTFDSRKSRFTFDGGDYMELDQSKDSGGVLENMGSIQNETYVFYFNPFIFGSADFHLIRKYQTVPLLYARIYVRVLAGANNFRWEGWDGSGAESLYAGTDSASDWDGKSLVLSFVRKTNSQEFFANETSIATGASTSRNGNNEANATIGLTAPATTGLCFFGYARRALTQTQISHLNYELRNLM